MYEWRDASASSWVRVRAFLAASVKCSKGYMRL